MNAFPFVAAVEGWVSSPQAAGDKPRCSLELDRIPPEALTWERLGRPVGDSVDCGLVLALASDHIPYNRARPSIPMGPRALLGPPRL